VTGVVAATTTGAPQLYEDVSNNLCCDWAVGDAAATDAAFAKAHHIAKIDLVNNRLVPNAMESRAALAEYEPATGDYTLYTSTQLPHVARVLIGVLMLGIPERKANCCTSRRLPPALNTSRAALVMKVRRPECEVQPSKPRSR